MAGACWSCGHFGPWSKSLIRSGFLWEGWSHFAVFIFQGDPHLGDSQHAARGTLLQTSDLFSTTEHASLSQAQG